MAYTLIPGRRFATRIRSRTTKSPGKTTNAHLTQRKPLGRADWSSKATQQLWTLSSLLGCRLALPGLEKGIWMVWCGIRFL